VPRPVRTFVVAAVALVLLAASSTACGLFDKTVDVLLIGDSIMNQSGDYVQAQLRKQQGLDDIEVQKDAVNGSGLLTPKLYDWQSKAEELVKETKPKVVVVLFIGNYTETDLFPASSDGHPIPNTYQADFFTEWGLQAKKLTQVLQANGARVDWVLPPPLKGAEGERREKLMRETYLELARQVPGVGLIDGRVALGGGAGEFTFKRQGIDGSEQTVRQGDAVHLTEAGGQLLARQIALAVGPELIEITRQQART
jgi:hypothetical protein